MKAAQVMPDAYGHAQVNEVPAPTIRRDTEMIVKIMSASLCHSDLQAVDGKVAIEGIARQTVPITLGHEGVGIIETVGPAVAGFEKGDRVGFLYHRGACYHCAGCEVNFNLCETGKQQLQGFVSDGFFAEYAVVESRNAIKMPHSLDLTRAAPLFCAGIIAFHSVRSCNLPPRGWLAVLGCGGLGQLACRYAKAMDYRVIGLDVNDDCLKQVTAAGADLVYNTKDDPSYLQALNSATCGGADAVGVYTGSSRAYSEAHKVLRVNGLLMLVGIPAEPLPVSVIDMCNGRYRIKAESTSVPRRMKDAIDFSITHNILPDVELYTLNDINVMIDKMKAGQSTKRMAVVFDI